jgi:phage repressor protein C with HTH and peptisase S24 domain
MGKVKAQWLEYLSEVLQLPETELLNYSLTELNNMLKIYEDSLEQKVQEQDNYIDTLMQQGGWDVDVDEDGHIFIINAEGIGGVS